jgi:hypothetical protein
MIASKILSRILVLLILTGSATAQGLFVRGTRDLTPRTHIALQGDIAYATGANSLAVLDVSNPNDPVIEGQVAPGVASLLSVSVANGYAYCAGQTSGLVIINVEDPEEPVWVTNRILSSQVVHASAADTLVVIATPLSVFLLGVTDPANPNILDIFGRDATWVELDFEQMIVHCGSNGGAYSLDIGEDLTLSIRDQFGSTALSPLTISRPYVNFARSSELRALTSDDYQLAGVYEASGAIRALAGADHFSFVGLATGEIQYLNQQQDVPVFVASATAPAGITGIAVNAATRVLVAAHGAGVTVLEYDPLAGSSEPTPALPGELSIAAFPNPFNSTITLQLETAGPGNYALRVTDILGRIVAERTLALTHSQEYDMDFSGQSAGSYFVRLSNNQTTATTRIVFTP